MLFGLRQIITTGDRVSKKVIDVLNEMDRSSISTGQILKAFRKGRGFTLKNLEDITGVSQTHLSSLENDRIELGVKRAGVLAAALGVDPQNILFPNGRWKKTKEHLTIEKKAEKLIRSRLK